MKLYELVTIGLKSLRRGDRKRCSYDNAAFPLNKKCMTDAKVNQMMEYSPVPKSKISDKIDYLITPYNNKMAYK